MSEADIGRVLLALGIIIALAHLLGYVFNRLKQPRLIGEILAGIVLGPFVLGKLAPSVFDSLFNVQADKSSPTAIVFGFMYWLGILLLMFLSGSQVRDLLAKENRRSTAFILGVGKPLAFLLVIGLGLASAIPLNTLTGTKGVEVSTLLILACAVAVTSIPVLSRIFQDLKIMETRFASLVLGAAVLEDIALWGILAVATSYAMTTHQSAETMLIHIATSLVYLVAGLTVLPKLLTYLRRWRWNLLFTTSPIAYAMVIFSLYVGLAGVMQVNLVFAAFLAGFGLVGGARGSEKSHFKEALAVLHKFSFAVLIPVYFALVGYRLVFNSDFSITMLLVFLLGSSAIAIISVGLSTRLAGFNKLDTANLAITFNARGGPGIVLASIAYDAGIINSAFYTTLVLTALITSQIAGSWLRYVLNKGWPLLSDAKIITQKSSIL
jgi:Kef-type K+ transport system membrane component KefB